MIHQYDIAIPSGASLTTGERRLLLATLQDALRTLLGVRYGSRHTKHQREDLDWLRSDDQDDPFTFLRICDALGIDAEWLRSRVLRARGETRDVGPRIVVGAARAAAEPWAMRLEARGGGR